MLDASALLALIFGEPGADRVLAALAEARLSAANFAEVVSKLAERGFAADDIAETVGPFADLVLPLSREQAYQAGAWRPATRAMGLSLGDRCCLALAMELNAGVITADRAWAGLDLGVPVEVIR